MASKTQDEVYRAFLAAAGQQMPASGDTNAILRDVAAQIRDVATNVATPAATSPTDNLTTDRAFLAASGQQTAALGDANAMLAEVIAQLGGVRSRAPTQVATNRTRTTTTSQDGGITLGSVASTVLKSGFGLAPLIGGLVNLFSGGGDETPAPLVKYALPPAIDFQAAQSNGRVTDLDYDQAGMARTSAERAGGSASINGSGAAAQITVNVQAMDARSFLDRSSDIALAVRDAMLNLNAINDVVNEL
jgi:hypothetical protein